ncbi:MAG: hypothetical protein D6719_13475 [Candidatus Dadabacteria bacterium]|nr:MAG: hypothetical protein D6719_13475 [Candidatus Dadabacteria bacterium]
MSDYPLSFTTSQNPKSDQIWLRISAFLSLRSQGTQRTYAGVICEWCDFLGAPAGSREAALLMLKASDLDALRYRKWLEGRPGQRPRITVSDEKSSSQLPVKGLKNSKKLDGLQFTLSNSTIAKKIAILRRIYRMLIGAGIGLKQNPFDSDKVPAPSRKSGQKRPTEMVPYQLVMKIVKTPDNSTPKGIRDRALLAVLFGGGLRRSEAVALRIADVKRSQKGTLYLRLRATKGKRDADQALPSWVEPFIISLLEQRRKEQASSGDYLFISYRGFAARGATRYPLSESGVYKLFKKYCAVAGAGKFLTPHSARATAITRLLENGIPHREVQEFSRHASVQMVEVYDKRRLSVDENPARELDYS